MVHHEPGVLSIIIENKNLDVTWGRKRFVRTQLLFFSFSSLSIHTLVSSFRVGRTQEKTPEGDEVRTESVDWGEQVEKKVR